MSRKKTVEQHIAAGTYRPSVHGPRPEETPTKPNGTLKRPVGLSGDAAKAWDQLVKTLGKRVQAEDVFQLEQLAVWLSKWRLIAVKLDAAEPGTMAFSRLVSAANTASSNFGRIASKFGLTPLDRSSLSLPSEGSGGAIRW